MQRKVPDPGSSTAVHLHTGDFSPAFLTNLGSGSKLISLAKAHACLACTKLDGAVTGQVLDACRDAIATQPPSRSAHCFPSSAILALADKSSCSNRQSHSISPRDPQWSVNCLAAGLGTFLG
ncbi:hypothetical protein V2G26_008163 [Clonostachys chloroleuca]